MDFEKLEEALDEIVWHMMKTLNDKGVEHHDVRMILDRIGDLVNHGEFEAVYSGFDYEKDDPAFKEFVRDVINVNSW